MRIGITFDLKSDAPLKPGQPDDLEEEFDSPVTVEAIAAVLRGLGHRVELLGYGRPLLATSPKGRASAGRVRRAHPPCWRCSASSTPGRTR